MTIRRLVEELREYAKAYGEDTKVVGYVGMSAEVAKARLEELTAVDEYVYDDFLEISHLNEQDGAVYIALEDVKE